METYYYEVFKVNDKINIDALKLAFCNGCISYKNKS